VQKFLSGVSYPASREDPIRRAESKQADEQSLAALRELPGREYSGPGQVSKEVARSRRTTGPREGAGGCAALRTSPPPLTPGSVRRPSSPWPRKV
jgi:hypothetical protein